MPSELEIERKGAVIFLLLYFVFNIGSCYILQVSLQRPTLQLQSLERWEDRYELPCQAKTKQALKKTVDATQHLVGEMLVKFHKPFIRSPTEQQQDEGS